ncbi:unnamed protein product [Callosobruchus maculatus]|uniref:Decaprenyl-diphosphate synthase subunit 2 n=1 Tax=Callosobruchus maculatus TaxID=64391 RepID=A0A653DBJ8_CALMS|nr:unnamed protein product [Callosobruchus maculatus]
MIIHQFLITNLKTIPFRRTYSPVFSNVHSVSQIRQRCVSNTAVNEAEKIVGYPTSFLSLRWLLNDEVANIALHLRKLIGTNHPLLSTARELILSKQTPRWGLIVLLVSKAGGLNREFSKMDCDVTAGILHSQRVLSEITEMIRTSNIIHKSILNVSSKDENLDDLNFGNKLSLLTGDYLLSTSFKELAGLKCHEVNDLISTCLRDLVEAEFIEPRDEQSRPLPNKPSSCGDIIIPNHFEEDVLKVSDALGNAKAEWTLRHLLDGASLLAKCCQIRDVVRSGTGLQKTMDLQQELTQNALDVLEEFPVTDARLALKNIINSMRICLP